MKNVQLKPNMAVEITGGAFQGQHGTIVRTNFFACEVRVAGRIVNINNILLRKRSEEDQQNRPGHKRFYFTE